MSDIKDINPDLDLHTKERILLANKDKNIVPYTVASAVEMKNGNSVEEHIKDMEERFAGVLNSTDDKSSLHHHDTLYYRKSEIDTKHTALEDRIASINSSDHSHNQYVLKTDVYTKLEFDSKFGGSLSEIVVKSDLDNYALKSNLSNYLTKSEATNYATKEDIESKSDVGHNHDERYYSRTYIDNNVIEEFRQEDLNIRSYVASELENKSDKSHKHSEYILKEETYDRDFLDGKFEFIDSSLTTLGTKVDANTKKINEINVDLENTVTNEVLQEKVNEIKTLIDGKANKEHTHSSDDIIYEEESLTDTILNIYGEIDDVIEYANNEFANKNHNHDNLYYTEEEMNEAFDAFNSLIENTYATKAALAGGLSQKSDIGHTHSELEDQVYELENTFKDHLRPENDVHTQYAIREQVYTMDEVDGLLEKIDINLTGNYVTKDDLQEELELKSDADHDHDDRYLQKLPTHDHNDLYYERTDIDVFIESIEADINDMYNKKQIDTMLNDKSDIYHNHDDMYSLIGHDHDKDYYKKDETLTREEIILMIPDVSNLASKDELDEKADVEHTHEDLENLLDSHTHNNLYYSKDETMTSKEIESFVESAITTGTIDMSAYATKKDLDEKADKEHTHSDLEELIVAIDENVANHNHNKLYYTKEESYSKEELNAKLEMAAQDGTIDMSNFAKKSELDKKADKEHTHENIDAEINYINDWVSKHSHTNFYTKDDTYSKSEIDDMLTNIDEGNINIDLGSYAKKTDLDKKLDTSIFETFQSDINTQLTNHNHDSKYYTKSETMTTEEINTAISKAIDTGLIDTSNIVSKDYLKEQLKLKSDAEHYHDDLYASINHSHDSKYYTKSETINKEEFDAYKNEITESTTNITSRLENTYSKTVLDSLLENKADAEHYHDDVYSPINHTHNGSYYTKEEVDKKFLDLEDGEIEIDFDSYAKKTELDKKADIDHLHDELYAPLYHDHNSLYYTKKEVDNTIQTTVDSLQIDSLVTKEYVDSNLANKSDKNHTHDNLLTIEEFENHNHNSDYYTKDQTLSKEQINATILQNIEDGDFATNLDMNDLLSKKASKDHRHVELETRITDNENNINTLLSHNHDERYYTEEEIDGKIKDINAVLDEKLNILELDNYLANKSDKNHTHNEFKDISDEITNIQNILDSHSHSEYAMAKDTYKKTEIDSIIEEASTIITDLESLVDTKANKSDLSLKADGDHNHDDVYSPIDHEHLQYMTKSNAYTKSEVDANITNAINQAILEGKENEADLSIYITKAETEAKLSDKSDIDHTHDDIYSPLGHKHSEYAIAKDTYTKTDVDELVTRVNESIEATNSSLNSSITTINKSLEGKSDIDHLHDDIYSPLGHTHKDLALASSVYTKEESDTNLADAINALNIGQYVTNNNFNNTLKEYSKLDHLHDDIYSPLGHNHDSRYALITDVMLKQDIETKFEEIDVNISNIDSRFSNYTTTKVLNELLAGKSDLDHNHDEQYSSKGHNHDKDYLKIEIGATKDELNEAITLLDITSYAKTAWVTAQLLKKSDIDHLHDDIYSPLGHTHDGRYYEKSLVYTKSEIDSVLNDDREAFNTEISNINSILANKSDKNHNHDEEYAALEHEHDTRYYTKTNSYSKSEIDSKVKVLTETFDNYVLISDFETRIAGKADKEHEHNKLYYTKDLTYSSEEIDGMVTGLNTSINNLSANIAKTYVKLDVYEDKVTELETSISGISTSLNSHKNDFEKFKKDVENNYATTEMLTLVETTLSGSISSVRATVEKIEKQLVNFVTQEEYTGFVTTVNNKISINENSIKKLREDLNAHMLEADEKYVLNDETYRSFVVNTNTNIAKLQNTLNSHLEDYESFVSTVNADISNIKSRVNTTEVNLTNLTKDFNTLVEETLPLEYVNMTTFNSYKSFVDKSISDLSKNFENHLTDYEDYKVITDTSLSSLGSRITVIDSTLKNFMEVVVPETYLDINTFNIFQTNTNEKISALDKKIKEHIDNYDEFVDTVNIELTTIKADIRDKHAYLVKKIDDNYNEFQEYIVLADEKFATKKDLNDYKSLISKTISEMETRIDEFEIYVNSNFATKLELENVNKSLTSKYNELSASLEEYIVLAEQTFATKKELIDGLKLKADLTWVEEQLETKSDVRHNHDDKYLPIINANMQGEPTTTTPSAGDESYRIPNTMWTREEIHTLRQEIDLLKLGREENAVSASKLETAREFTFTGDTRGSVLFDGTENVTVDLDLIGNAPTSSKWENDINLSIDGIAEGNVSFDGSSDVTLTLNYSEGSTAPQAVKWAKPMQLSLEGGIIGEVSFDGSKDVAMQTEIVGNAPTASKLYSPVTINAVEFDGSKNIVIADDTKLPKSGGEMSGSIVMVNGIPVQFKDSIGTERDVLNLNKSNKLILGYSGLLQNEALVYSGTNAYPIRHAGFTDYDITGNSATATQLQTARNFSISGAVTTDPVIFDGSSDVNLVVKEVKLDSPSLTGILPIEKGGTGNNWGEAPSATKLHNIVSINEALFDGTANITIGTLTPIKIPASELIPTGSGDLNNYKKPGMYYCESSSTASGLSNCPTKNAFSLLVEKHSGYHQKIVEHMTGSHKIFVRNFSGNAWGQWYELYSTANEPSKIADQVKNPLSIRQLDAEGNVTVSNVFNGSEKVDIDVTPANLKVLPLIGGNLTGHLVFENEKSNIQFKNSGGTAVDVINMSSSNILNIGNNITKSNIVSSTNPTTTIDGNTYTFYHTGNIPTPAEVGAVNKEGDTMVGSLTMGANSFVKFPTTHNKVTLTNETAIIPGASVLSNSDANIRIASPYSIGFTPTTSGGKVTVGNNAFWFDVKNGDLYASGNIYENVGDGTHSLQELYMGIIKDNSGFYGMKVNGSTTDFVRTTESGLIPSADKKSNLGTDRWNFAEAYVAKIHEENQPLSERYIALCDNTKFENSKTISLAGNSIELTLDRMQKCTSSFTNGRAYTIKLPTVSNLKNVNGDMDTVTIHILFTAMTGGTLSFTNASGLKWYATPHIISGKMHEFIFTYYNGTWVGGVIHYG